MYLIYYYFLQKTRIAKSPKNLVSGILAFRNAKSPELGVSGSIGLRYIGFSGNLGSRGGAREPKNEQNYETF